MPWIDYSDFPNGADVPGLALGLKTSNGVDIRRQRNVLIAESDWMANSDVTMSDEWRAYRQALRDITMQSDPQNIVWPAEPE